MAVKAGRSESYLALTYALVACIGFAVDAGVLTVLEGLGVQPAWARVFSLTGAMQVTFWINGFWVFRCLTLKTWGPSWVGYMATSGFGNFCNYWAFVSLVSLHSVLWSNRWLDLVVGGVLAWAINYACARLLVFGAEGDGSAETCTPIGRIVERLTTKLNARRRRGAALATGIEPARR